MSSYSGSVSVAVAGVVEDGGSGSGRRGLSPAELGATLVVVVGSVSVVFPPSVSVVVSPPCPAQFPHPTTS